jgi:hypothetical protein
MKNIRHNFLYKFTALNIFGVILLLAAYIQGWITQIIITDISHITLLIASLFFIGLCISTYKAWKLDKKLEWIDKLNSSVKFNKSVEILSIESINYISIISLIGKILLLMGFMGTMIGIILALKSVETFSTGGDANMLLAIVMLFKGIYVKFYASLVGIVAHAWTLTNNHMLTSISRRILVKEINHA